jgi:tetratricopeptide (TPR) repeat protein
MHTLPISMNIFKKMAALLALCGVLTGTGWPLVAQANEYADVNKLVSARKLGEALMKADLYLADKPRDPQMRFIKGVIFTDMGQPSEALTIFTKLNEDYPELPEPYNNLAVLYAGQGQFDQARSALAMAIRTNPRYATAHENLGDVYLQLASQSYAKALQLEPRNAGIPAKLALIRTLFSPPAKAPVRPMISPMSAPLNAPLNAPTTAPVSAPASKP